MKRLLFLALFSAICISLIYWSNLPEKSKELPVINPIDVNEEMVDPELVRLGYGHKIAHFSLLDQDSRLFNDRQLKGKVYVAEYFFTTCKTICPIMNGQMCRVQKALNEEQDFAIVSFTVDPETDTPERLKQYCSVHNAIPGKWHFLTGTKHQLYNLARKSFFVLKPAEVVNQGDVGSDFIHTNHFVLVDQERRIRGYYDGTNPKDVDRLISDAKKLLSKEN
jgi:protein SCO1/2